MAKTKISNEIPVSMLNAPNEFEAASRLIRWLVVAVVVVTFPVSHPHAATIYSLAILAIMYNSLRYIPRLLRSKVFASPAVVIAIDTFFICSLITVVGNVSTPYSAFLFLMITSAAYWYRLKGVAAVVLLQVICIAAARQIDFFGFTEFEFARNIAIIVAALLTLGIYIERLTKVDKEERDTFRYLAKVNESESSLLLTLVDSLRSALFVVDRTGVILQNNGAASVLCDTDGSLKGQQFNKVLPLYVRTDPDAKPVKVISAVKDSQHRRDLRVTFGNKQSLDLDVTVTPVQLHGTQTTHYVVLCEDITHELSLSEQQTEFISVASHELRTPIAIMEAALSTLLHTKEALSDTTVQIIDQAHSNALLLSGIVKDLSIISEAKNDNIPVQLENINAGRMASQIADDFKRQITHKGLTFELKIEPNLPTVLSTERHIREILQNYMTNAIKYSNEGTVGLRVAPAKNGGVVYSVKDTGIGITPSAQKNLFNKFFRAEDPRTQRVGGTGLGLYLCRELATRLGAKVWCESTLGKGSVFYLEIPPFSALRKDRSEVIKSEVASLVDSI